MTLLEKCREEHPGLDEGDIISFLCPCDFGYEKLNNGCEQEGEVQKLCRDCWNRPADAAGGGKSQPVCSAAVEKCEEEREPEAFFGNRKAVREAPDGPPRAQGESAQSVERGRPGPSAPTDNGGGPDNGG